MPWLYIGLRWIMFPADSFYWRMSHRVGYDFTINAWRIGGAVFPHEVVRSLAASRGHTFRVWKTRSGVIGVKRVVPPRTIIEDMLMTGESRAETWGEIDDEDKVEEGCKV